MRKRRPRAAVLPQRGDRRPSIVVLAPGNSYGCSFSGNFAGVAGDSQADTVTAAAADVAGITVSDADTATVSIAAVTSVRLRSFSARRSKSGAVLTWRTAWENDILGFNVYRQEAEVEPQAHVARRTVASYAFA